MKQKTHTLFTANIENLSHEGRGIARIEQKTTFIRGALPGEQVEFSYQRKKTHFDEGILHNVITASPQRTAPRCPHFGVCGGCSLQHMQHDLQIQFKQSAVKELLQQAGITTENWLPPLIAKSFEYRRKARLSVRFVNKKGKVLVGFRERSSRYVADLSICHVLPQSVGHNLTKLAEMIGQLDGYRTIPQIEVAIGDNQNALIIRHLDPLSKTDLTKITVLCQQLQFTLYLQSKGIDSIQLHTPSNAKPLHYKLIDFNLTLEFSPHHFIQVNAAINQQMIQRAIKLLNLQATDNVLDLYCGIGNFSLPMAQQCQFVTGVEGDLSAVTQAQHNAKLNQINNCSFHTADLANTQQTYLFLAKGFDKILLDPARAGAAEILTLLPQWNPKAIVYVSCNPSTFARDAAIIKQHGYLLKNIGIMDMFPQTQHIEVISLFERR